MGSIRAAAVTGSPVTRLHRHVDAPELRTWWIGPLLAHRRSSVPLALRLATLALQPALDRSAGGAGRAPDPHRTGGLVESGGEAFACEGSVAPLRAAVLRGDPQRVAQDVACPLRTR